MGKLKFDGILMFFWYVEIGVDFEVYWLVVELVLVLFEFYDGDVNSYVVIGGWVFNCCWVGWLWW